MEVILEYDPREHQLEVHRNLKRWNVLICHRRFGKTVLCINQLIVDALKNTNKLPRYAYIAPYYKQAKAIAWDYLKQFTSPIPGMVYNEQELSALFPGNGAKIRLFGAENPDSLRGIYYDGVVFDEYAQMSPRVWSEIVRPSLIDRKGYAIFIGTPQGHNSFYDLFMQAKNNPDWYTQVFKASETKVIEESELVDARRIMSKDEYEQEFECSFDAAIQGSVYGEQIQLMREQNRICKVPYDPKLKLYTVWDPGDAHTASVFFQLFGKEIRIVHAVELFNPQTEDIFDAINSKNYNYAYHFLPMDATVQKMQTGMSLKAQLIKMGLQNVRDLTAEQAQTRRVNDGIKIVKSLMPNMWVDESLHDLVIEPLLAYHYELNEKREVFSSNPVHDWSSHMSDAIRYMCIAISQYINVAKPLPQQPPQRQLPSWALKAGIR